MMNSRVRRRSLSNIIRQSGSSASLMKPVSAKGPVQYTTEGQQIVFAPLARLAPKADTTFVVRATAEQAGDLRIRVQLRSGEMTKPVTKEESTRVFSDQ